MSDTNHKLRAMAMLRRLRRKPLLRISGETAETFGRLAAKLTQAGRGMDFRIQDLWLAAQAVQRKFTLLATSAKDFRDIPGLKLLVLRIP